MTKYSKGFFLKKVWVELLQLIFDIKYNVQVIKTI